MFRHTFFWTLRPRRLKLGTHVNNGQMYMYNGIRLLLRLFISSFFFLSNFQTLKFFVTFFSGTVRHWRLKLGTHVDSGQMYRVDRNQAAAVHLYLYFFVFLTRHFPNIKSFCHIFLRNCEALKVNLCTHVAIGQIIVYTGIRLLLLIRLFIPVVLHFTFSPIFKHYIFSSHFSQELWGIEGWNLVYMWTVARWKMYIRISLLLLISSFFFRSNFQTLKFFVTLFSRTVKSWRLKLSTHVDSGQMYRVYRNQAAAAYSSLYLSQFSFFLFLQLSIHNISFSWDSTITGL